MALTLATSTHKGGVGKTSLLVQLAHIYAEAGLKTLIIDLDAQGNCSLSFLKEPYTGTPAYSLFEDELSEVKPQKLADNLWGLLQPMDLEYPKQLKEMSAILDDKDNEKARAKPLFPARNLAGIKDDFDIILVDTPPGMSTLLVGALLAVDHVIVPCDPVGFTKAAVAQIYDTIGNLKTYVGHELNVVGLFFNKVQLSVPAHKKNIAMVREMLPDLVFKSHLGNRSKLVIANEECNSLSAYKDSTSRSTRAELKDIAKEVLQRAGAKKLLKEGGF